MEKVYSKTQILLNLNDGATGSPWVEIPGVYALPNAIVNGDKVSTPSSAELLILKCFIKPDTGEIRTFLSKLLSDEPLTINLA